jgi:MFS family permease
MVASVPAVRRADKSGGDDGRRWLMLAVLLVGQFMGLLDVLIVNVAMPAIGADLHASGASLQLVVGGYTVAYAMSLITGARLGDLYGRRRMYRLGVIVFTAASLVCGFAPDTLTLVVFRFVQGAGAAVMVPQIMSLIQLRFSGRARAQALSAYGVVLSAGAVVGLVVGGVVVSADLLGATWRPVFLVNVPLGVLLTVLVPRVIPADGPDGGRRLDVRGLAIAAPAVVLVVLPLVLGHELGWPLWTLAGLAAGAALAVVFVLVERRTAARGGDPLLNLDVVRAPGFVPGLGALACMQLTYGGFLFVFTLHLEAGLGDSAVRTGLAYVPMSVTFGLSGFFWRKLPEGSQPWLAPAGLVMCGLAFLGVAAGGPLTWVALAVDGVGMGLSTGPLLTQSLVRVTPRTAADASGLLTTTMQLGQVLGVAVFGTVFLSLWDSLRERPAVLAEGHASAAALSTTAWWLALLALAGVAPAVLLSRTLTRARRRTSPVSETS